MYRCLLCKAFIKRCRQQNCKRCGAMNYDPSLSGESNITVTGHPYIATTSGSGNPYAYRYAYVQRRAA